MAAKKANPPAKRGRPSKYSPRIVAEICRRISDGESLRSVCSDPEMPSRNRFLAWLSVPENKDLRDQYAHSRRECAYARLDRAFDRIEDIVTYIDEAGNHRLDPAAVNQARLYCDMAKWEASKLIPEYGDKLDVTATITPASLFAAAAREEADDGDA